MATSPLKTLYEVYPNDPRALQPLGIRVNDTIYAGGLIGADPATGQLAPDLESQMALALEHVKILVEKAGGTLDNVARCVAYVTTPDHREPTDAVWMKVFPNEQDKPAFKIVTTELPPGQFVRLDALALVGAKRTRFDLPNITAHDPTVRVGNYVFTSRLHGNSPADGKMVEGGLDAEAAQIMRNMVQLMEAAGGGKDDIVQVNTFGNEPSYIPGARKAFEAAFPDPARRPVLHPLLSWVRATSALMAEGSAVLRNQSGEAVGEPFQELFLAPEHHNIAAGVRLGSLVFTPGLTGSDPKTGKLVGPGTEEQLRAALDNVDLLVERAGGTREHLARVNVFMKDVGEKDAILNPIWQERFPDPDQRPPHSYIPAPLPEGQRVSIQVVAVLGATRRSLYVEGVEHGDPMTLAAQTGNLVFSSRIFGRSNDPAEHTQRVFATAERLLTQAGGGLGNLQQALIYISDPEYHKAVEDRWRQVGASNNNVRFNYVETDLGRGKLLPRLQMIAVV